MKLRLFAVLVALAIGGALAAWWLGRDRAPAAPAPLGQLAADLESLARTFPPPGSGPIELPRDHAAKPGEFVESWFLAGVLQAPGGGLIGVQFLIERLTLTAAPAARESTWGASAVWRALLMVEPADIDSVREDRLGRGALGLAGASTEPVEVWVDDWRIGFDAAGERLALKASSPAAALRLDLDGLEESPAAFATPAYRGYWQPGLSARGQVEFRGQAHEVHGQMFLERSWGRAQPAGRGQLALARLWVSGAERADGWLRCERLQRRQGGGVPLVECIAPDGTAVADVDMTPAGSARRVVDGIQYPLQWRVAVPGMSEAVRLEPLAAAHPPALEGGWRGVLTDPGRARRWGVLVLSNFGEPAGSGDADR